MRNNSNKVRQEGENKVGVVLINWNSSEHTLPCIQSILNSNLIPSKIVVVDNASVDDSVNLIHAEYPDVVIIKNDENYGFTGANNIGIKYLLDNEFDYVWILNNDTIVDSNCLRMLLECFKIHPDVGASTAKIYYYKPDNLLWYCGTKLNRSTLKAHHRGQDEVDHGQFDETQEIGFFDGCCILLDNNTLNSVGYFDERFFAYSEDIDYSYRIRALSKKIIYEPKAMLWHKVGSSIKKFKSEENKGSSTPLQYFLTTRNYLYIVRRYGSFVHILLIIFIRLIYAFFISSILLTMRRYNKVYAIWYGIFHGIVDDIHCIKVEPQNMPYNPWKR